MEAVVEYTIKHFLKGHCTGSDSFRGFGLETVTRQALRAVQSGHTDRADVAGHRGRPDRLARPQIGDLHALHEAARTVGNPAREIREVPDEELLD